MMVDLILLLLSSLGGAAPRCSETQNAQIYGSDIKVSAARVAAPPALSKWDNVCIALCMRTGPSSPVKHARACLPPSAPLFVVQAANKSNLWEPATPTTCCAMCQQTVDCSHYVWGYNSNAACAEGDPAKKVGDGCCWMKRDANSVQASKTQLYGTLTPGCTCDEAGGANGGNSGGTTARAGLGPGWLSIVSVASIILGVALLFVVGGAGVNKWALKKSGAREVWAHLGVCKHFPLLVVDGLIFSFSCAFYYFIFYSIV